jgi:hypothetical protein
MLAICLIVWQGVGMSTTNRTVKCACCLRDLDVKDAIEMRRQQREQLGPQEYVARIAGRIGGSPHGFAGPWKLPSRNAGLLRQKRRSENSP